MSYRSTGALAAIATIVSLLVLIAAIQLLGSSDAAAYSAAPRYGQEATRGGGGGRFFTGSPVDGYTCDVCHEGGTAVEIDVSGLPRGGYEPGHTYELTLRWHTEEMFSLVAEFMTDDGTQAGAIAIPEDPPASSSCTSGVRATELYEDQPGRQIAALVPCGASSMTLEWTAPDELEACDADAVLYIAGVHGDETESPDGDGVTLLRRRIAPADADACETSGCSIAARSREAPALLAFLLVAGRRRRSR
jgi:hypothetical protein